MDDWTTVGRLKVGEVLRTFVRDEALPGTGVSEEEFWPGLEAILDRFTPLNRALLAKREQFQAQIDDWHRQSPGPITDVASYIDFLRNIGYLVPEPSPFRIETQGVDTEVRLQAGPQLVVPVLNARFAVNAANARWGSLYDALYGTDTVPETEGAERSGTYNPLRGAKVVAWGRAFLDSNFPLATGSHSEATGYEIADAGLLVSTSDGLTPLRDPDQFVAYQGDAYDPEAIVLIHHGLHVEIQRDRTTTVGKSDAAGISDLILEAAVSTIMDLEDSVAAVDAEDKVQGYRNWYLLNRGTLSAEVSKQAQVFTRKLSPDRTYKNSAGRITLPGRSLLFVRQVGLHMTTDAILFDGEESFEGILDAVFTALGSMVDLQGRGSLKNSRTGAMYAVKPKLHGPEEVAFTDQLYAAVEDLLKLTRNTIKLGIMDEERRTSANLKACILAAKSRLVFINTGFLDRTGDELHTSMVGGAMIRKGDMRTSQWITAYEDQNVDIGLACGFQGRAQIGKGMWAAPDEMADMLEQKIVHPRSGASCAWVPSPTAATLHALHYHEIDVSAQQSSLKGQNRTTLEELLTVPFAEATDWSAEQRLGELENNLQSILGYVKRWVDNGVGCSKVPDIHGTALMEDRATCRISSQHVANWLLHGIVSADEVEEGLMRMARVVDLQQGSDNNYRPLDNDEQSPAFRAAHDLVFKGVHQPSGYTEYILRQYRRDVKGRAR